MAVYQDLYKVKVGITPSKHRKQLIKHIQRRLDANPHIVCNSLNRRKVHLDKFLIVNSRTRSNINRLQAFSAAVETVRKARTYSTVSKYKQSFEFRAVTFDGKIIVAHVRDDPFQGRNRRLYLISCYWREE